MVAFKAFVVFEFVRLVACDDVLPLELAKSLWGIEGLPFLPRLVKPELVSEKSFVLPALANLVADDFFIQLEYFELVAGDDLGHL